MRPDEMVRVEHADVVVLGAGVAGAVTATALAAVDALRVTVLAAARPGEGGSTPWAQGGVAAAVGPDDHPSAHAHDTVRVAGGLSEVAVAARIAEAAPEAVAWLAEVGVAFDRKADGSLSLGREGGHSAHRILHAAGDRTGAEIARAVSGALRASRARIVAPATAVRLLVGAGGVEGVLARHDDGRIVAHLAPATVIATGGIGQLFARTTNPPGTVGDGIALAARAGATIADAEMVQFHPTAMDVDADPLPLLSEALRGAGAVLVDEAGRPLLTEHPMGSLAPRDVVSQAVWRTQRDGGRVGLDARHLFVEGHGRFPAAASACIAHGIDPAREPIPVTPAAHYHMGGVATDLRGRSTLAGLWAVGEVAATGLHGANRLASNSLLEAAVVGREAAADVISCAGAGRDRHKPGAAAPTMAARHGGSTAGAAWMAEIRDLLWRGAGVSRTEGGLSAAITRLEAIRAAAPPESAAGRAALTGLLVAVAAAERRETRGAHVREDYPTSDPAQARRRGLVLDGDGRVRPAPLPEPVDVRLGARADLARSVHLAGAAS